MVEYTHDIFLTRAEVVRRRSMSFIKEYAQKLVTAEEAVKVVKSHDWVDYGWDNRYSGCIGCSISSQSR